MSRFDAIPRMPQLAQTGPFYCDRCRERIIEPRDAWGSWYRRRSPTKTGLEQDFGFTITHGISTSPDCLLPEYPEVMVGSESLELLLSPDGFARLLEFAVERDVDPAELGRFLMRLFMPGYEHVFRHTDRAMFEGVLEQRSHKVFLNQNEIEQIRGEYRKGPFSSYS